jgi:hypothetical protein
MLKKVLNKVFGLYIHSRYKKIDRNLRYFIQDTYHCELAQWKYVAKDYLKKKKYKTISYQGEFGPELQFVLPFAYWHYKNGTLKTTLSSKFTSEFYYFSPDHKEVFDLRTNEGNFNYEVPRILYSHNYDMKKWLAVPLKEVYKNDIYVYDKPPLVIANRYNKEWDGPPISFFSIEMLDYIIENLKDNYTIIYNRPGAGNITMDNSDIYELNEMEWIRTNHPEVVLMDDLYKENKGGAKNFNHLQLMVYANCENFISTHGGTSVLASYFKGTNVILSKQGPEHVFNCYNKLYPKLSGARIFHAKSYDELKQYIKSQFNVRRRKVDLV